MSSIEPGAIIDGKYRVVRRIGEGGMGTVYEGENIRIERRVAIKVLHEHVASSPEFAERFEREARASARVGSEHVCDVLDLGDLPNGERYLVMEFLDGESLEDRLERSILTAEELAPIAFQILEGLGTMHSAGVIHRDLKPANVFLARAPRKATEIVKILDFGVAKIQPRADQPSAMTSTGMMMGTPLYMSPEQARGARDVDGRTDIYAASVIFYRALTGEIPHTGANLNELLFKIVLEDARPIRELAPAVDEAFAAIVTRGLSRDPDQRFPSARAYQEEIVAWGRSKGDPKLLFNITLTDRPPPLASLSGGYPVERIAAATMLAQGASSERAGPPTPQGIAPGTPMNWAGATLEAGPRTSEQMKGVVTAGKTQVIESHRRPTLASATSGAVPVVAPPRGGRTAAIVAALGVAVLAGGGVWLASNKSSAPKPAGVVPSAPSAQDIPPTPSAEPAPVVTAQAVEPQATAEPQATTEPPATSVAAPASARAQRPVAKTSNPTISTSKTAVGPSASASPSPVAPPTTPTTTGHRKFRTDL